MSRDIEKYIHLSKYARWRGADNRRETWGETVDRYSSFFSFDSEVTEAIRSKGVMPSMRAMMTAGPALSRCNTVGYNCAAIAVDSPRVFDEHFYLLMGGSGVGYSVERQYINKMPVVAEEFFDTDTVIKVADSRIGWAKALKELISLLYNGDVPKWDTSNVRAEGSRLKTMGGRASGPVPLVNLFKYVTRVFKGAKGRRINSAECHKLMCKIAEAVIVGSVRRSACISMGNLTDDRHRRLKTGEWWMHNPELALANNSVMYTEKPDLDSFTKEFRSIYKSRSGERGMVNQEALRDKAMQCGRGDEDSSYLVNPCGEAILRDSGGLCNLTEVVIRPQDSLDTLEEKVRIATVIGTHQASLTSFRYLRKVWTTNAEEERLLGVSLTGIMDHDVMSGGDELIEWLTSLRKIAKDTNLRVAKELGIGPALQIGLVKPSGTVSQLCSTSSGIHPRFSEYYIRRVTQDPKDPLTQLMVDQGIPYVEVADKVIFSFPVKSPDNSVVSMSTMEQLGLWSIYREHWCDGNPSQTIYYTDDTFLQLQQWVWDNWSSIGGLSFFPKDDNVYENAPFEEITKEEYESFEFPEKINWDLSNYELEDNTVTEVAVGCSGGACEV